MDASAPRHYLCFVKRPTEAPVSGFVHPLRAFSDVAKPRVEIWRTLLGVAMAVALIFAFGALTRIAAYTSLHGVPRDLAAVETLNIAERVVGLGSGRLSMLVTLVTFLAVWPALWLTLRVVHKRAGSTLFGPDRGINWRHLRIGLGVSLGVGALAWLPMLHAYGLGPFESAPVERWLALLVIAIPLVFVQSAAEELFFRGYLLQQIAARTWSILGWSVLPSLLFALAHPEGAGPWGISWYHFVFGLVMAAVTSRTANLGGAIGMHLGNNAVNLLLVSSARHDGGLALFTYGDAVNMQPALYTYIGVMFIGATIFMARMDLKFLRQWKAQKRAREEAGLGSTVDELPVRIYAPASKVEPPAGPVSLGGPGRGRRSAAS